MKKLKLLAAAFAITIMGCSSDDDNNSKGYAPLGLEGEWHLVEVMHGFAGTSSEFEEGMVTWDFDESERKVAIENNSTDPMSGHDTGTYDYTFEEVEEVCENGFVIGTTHYGCVNIDGNTLRLTEIHVDGPVYIFNR